MRGGREEGRGREGGKDLGGNPHAEHRSESPSLVLDN